MSGATKIEWTERTWNPIRARVKAFRVMDGDQAGNRWGYHCEKVSPGCKNCYAENMNARKLPAWGTGLDYTVPNRENVEIYLDPVELGKPLHWKKPARIFPCSMTDLFAEFVPITMIEDMWEVMHLAQRNGHDFQVLTKRAERMREVLKDWGPPSKNIHLGVSVEDQQRADERIPYLLRTPAAVRWISYEPALGPVDFRSSIGQMSSSQFIDRSGFFGLHWVVIGGESGPGARPFQIKWALSIIDQCRKSGVPVFMKQVGAKSDLIDWMEMRQIDRKGGDPLEWPADIRIRELPA